MRIFASGHLARMPVFQQPGGVQVVAFADEHRVHAVVFVGVHLFQDAGQHAGLSAGLVEKVDPAVAGAAAQHPHVQPPGDEADDLVHAAVLGQVLKAGQREEDMGGLGKFFQGKADVVETNAFPDQGIGQFCGVCPARRRSSGCPE